VIVNLYPKLPHLIPGHTQKPPVRLCQKLNSVPIPHEIVRKELISKLGFRSETDFRLPKIGVGPHPRPSLSSLFITAGANSHCTVIPVTVFHASVLTEGDMGDSESEDELPADAPPGL